MPATMTEPMPAETTVPTSASVRGRRRLCIDAHTDFVTTLVEELQTSVARLQALSGSLVAAAAGTGDVVAADLPGLDRQARDIARLVGLLDAIDGPAAHRRLGPLSLTETILESAGPLDVKVEVSGRAGGELFVADHGRVRMALELVLLALAGDGKSGPVQLRISGDRLVALDGTMDLTDPRRSWQLRSGRRVLEGEGFRVRLMGSPTRYRVELRVGR
jgi:hypothetical protein